MWAGTTLFAKEYFRHEREGLARYWLFVVLTLGATQGVMLSADLMTTFVFFEILSLTSFTWVIHEETKGAIRAAYTYLFIAIIGGLILFMGLLLMQATVGTLYFADMKSAIELAATEGVREGAAGVGANVTVSAAPVILSAEACRRRILAAGICILLGFGAKAGMFPVHVWLPKAHPVAPSPASALLSGILTKVGVFGILMTATKAMVTNLTFGTIIISLGVVTMFLGALLALFSVNLKRTLACSSMSQIGFILVGIGSSVLARSLFEDGGEAFVLAYSGTMLHMVNHSLLKLVLFMCAGTVVMNIHALDLNAVRGYGRNKLPLKIAFLLGAVGIGGVPLFNGYVSKTMLHEGIVVLYEMIEEELPAFESAVGLLRCAEWIFLVSGGLTCAYMLKLFICVFVEKNEDPVRQAFFDADDYCMNNASKIAVCGGSVYMVLLGIPAVMKNLAAFMTGEEEILEFHAFTFGNLKGGGISILIGLFVYLVLVRHVFIRDGRYVNLWPEKLDLEDLLYRPLLTLWLPNIFGEIARVFGENRILAPVCRQVPKAFGTAAAVFGEDMILKPLAHAAVFAGTFISRVLSDSLDAAVVFLRKKVMRESPVK
jgi:hydrogenase-4 component B